MTDNKADIPAKKEAVRSHMSVLRTLSNQRPWWNFVMKGALISKQGTYLNWWQMGLTLVLLLAFVLYAVWAVNDVAQQGRAGIKRVAENGIKLIDELKDKIKVLEADTSTLTRELEDCRNGTNAKPAE